MATGPPLSRLPIDTLGLALGFLPVADVANARVASTHVRTAADGPALWGIILRERAKIEAVKWSAHSDADGSVGPKQLARQLCLGRLELDNARAATAESPAFGPSVHRWQPLLRCTKHGQLLSVPAAVSDLEAVQQRIHDSGRGHRALDRTPVAVTTVLVPSLDPATLALCEAVLADVLGVEFQNNDSRPGERREKEGSQQRQHTEAAAPPNGGGGGGGTHFAAGPFGGVPTRFPSLSMCAVHARRPLSRRALVSDSLRQRCPADVRCVVLFASIPAADVLAPSDDPEEWIDEAAVVAAAGRVLLAALGCASNVVCVNASPRCDLGQWQRLLRRSTRCPGWADLPMLAARRDSACTLTYVVTSDAARGTSLESHAATLSSGGSARFATFDPLAELTDVAEQTAAGGRGPPARIAGDADANWFDFGLVNKTAGARGYAIHSTSTAGGPTRPQNPRDAAPALRHLDSEDAAAIAELRAAAAAANAGGVAQPTGEMAVEPFKLPGDISEVLKIGAGRPFLLLPLTAGAAHGGLHVWSEVSALLAGVVRRGGNPAASLDQLVSRNESARAFASLPRAAARFYTTAMAIEVDDAARPEATHWVDVTRASRAITSELDRAYATSAATAGAGSSNRNTGNSLSADDDGGMDDDDAGAAAAEEDDDVSGEEPSTPEEQDFVPLTPAELVAPSDVNLAAIDPAAAAPLPPAHVLVPMEVEALLDAHEKYSSAALRQLVHSMGGSVGHQRGFVDGVSVDVATGHELLETLKADLSQSFRALWASNQTRSRVYCEAILARIFARVENHFTGPNATALRDDPAAPRRWYHTVRACIEEYVVRALGGRAYDVLSAHVVGTVIPEFRAACAARNAPDASLVDLCAASLENEVVALHRRHVTERDTRLSRRQMTIAQLGMYIGSEWTAAGAQADLSKLARDLTEDVAADWASCTFTHLARLAAGGIHIPEGVAWSEAKWVEWFGSIRGHLEGRAQEAVRAMHSAEVELGLRTAEAHNTSAIRERERRERVEGATGVVRLFNMLRSPFNGSD